MVKFNMMMSILNTLKKMLSDDWEGDEEIFVPEEESSKPFNTPTILGCSES